MGNAGEISNLEVAEALLERFGLMGEKDKYLDFVVDRKINDKRYHICTRKMEELGWTPSILWDEGIERTSKSSFLLDRFQDT